MAPAATSLINKNAVQDHFGKGFSVFLSSALVYLLRKGEEPKLKIVGVNGQTEQSMSMPAW